MAVANLNKIFSFYEEVHVSDTLKTFISPNEKICFVLKTLRDMAVFTDKRILVADKQGSAGKKVEYFSIPFKNIITYAVETTGTFDLDPEIRLVLSSGITIELKFMKGKSMEQILKVYHLVNDFMIS